ncbi:methyltransferase [Paenibacillus dendritiformis]|uniref:class I SAM-dependent methyltransferase n=1 Tax=Paenibacillus dendritiformis TaxID=130049 RepID=UPI001B11E715|nr:class I SAM-dependent methyltransferase [Paenibacillus dendritiformis]GIO74753.1 methyltransferase [Paenibacillus dendritiformis]
MIAFDEKAFYDRIGSINGWEFNSVRSVTEGAAWDYGAKVREWCKPTDVLLDIGTGGGETLLPLAQAVRLAIGIDRSPGMIETARRHAARSSVRHVRFACMDAEELAFPDGLFDAVICRHAPFAAGEAARVLTDGGVFITQQVSERDKWNVKEAFGRGQAYGEPNGTLMRRCAGQLKEAGFTEIHCDEYDAAEYLGGAEDLLFLLKHTPIIPGFGEIEGDAERFERFIAANGTERGIRTNSARFLIMARR